MPCCWISKGTGCETRCWKWSTGLIQHKLFLCSYPTWNTRWWTKPPKMTSSQMTCWQTLWLLMPVPFCPLYIAELWADREGQMASFWTLCLCPQIPTANLCFILVTVKGASYQKKSSGGLTTCFQMTEPTKTTYYVKCP